MIGQKSGSLFAPEGMEYLTSGRWDGTQTSMTLQVPPRDHLTILWANMLLQGTSASARIPEMVFNGDAGTNYWYRGITSVAGGVVLANTEAASAAFARMGKLNMSTSTGHPRSVWASITNDASSSKVGRCFHTAVPTAAPATAGTIEPLAGFEWVNTTNQITSILFRATTNQAISTKSFIVVFGSMM